MPFIAETPGVDRDGKPCGPTLLACSCCGAGKGEEHKRNCYVWSSRYDRRIHCWNAACVALERALAAQSYGTSPLLRAIKEERVRLTPGRVPG